jgi:hypothetical protein
MAEPELAQTNGDASSRSQSLISSGSEKQVPPKTAPLHQGEPLVSSASEQQGLPNAVALPHNDASVSSGPHEQVPPNGIHNKLLEQVIRTPGRQPSPQPTHLSIPGPNQHRLLHEEGPGYVAPKFEGKEQQMEEGTFLRAVAIIRGLTRWLS